jgi:hypothetical protein
MLKKVVSDYKNNLPSPPTIEEKNSKKVPNCFEVTFKILKFLENSNFI